MSAAHCKPVTYHAESDSEEETRPSEPVPPRPHRIPVQAAPVPRPRSVEEIRQVNLTRFDAFLAWLRALDIIIQQPPHWLDQIIAMSGLFVQDGTLGGLGRASVAYFKIFPGTDLPHIFMLSCLNYSRIVANPFAALGAKAAYLAVLWIHSFLVLTAFNWIWRLLLGSF
jgi:hypothetical protein